MKLAQRKIKWLARLMLGLMLFAQGMVAANACVAPNASPVQAYAVEHAGESASCHEETTSNANACLSHCTQADQISVDQHTVPLAIPVSVVAWISNLLQQQPVRASIIPEQLALNTGPPLSILFCSFLN